MSERSVAINQCGWVDLNQTAYIVWKWSLKPVKANTVHLAKTCLCHKCVFWVLRDLNFSLWWLWRGMICRNRRKLCSYKITVVPNLYAASVCRVRKYAYRSTIKMWLTGTCKIGKNYQAAWLYIQNYSNFVFSYNFGRQGIVSLCHRTSLCEVPTTISKTAR